MKRLTSQRWFCWKLGIALAFGITRAMTIQGDRALAQIIPDTTLGLDKSLVTPNTNIGGSPANKIDGGAIRGVNLFHSFLEFNVANGQRVYFANTPGIENIFSRVTGNNPSNILGTLGVTGGANLFLLNPNGIIFGSNAKLDIAGSFLASTANSLVFKNGSEFSAKNPQAPPLLTINLRPGLQYGENQSATISNTGNLAVGGNLTLAAGNLNLQGKLEAGRNLTLKALDTVQVRDSTISPFLAVAGGKLLIQGNRIVDIFALNHPASGLFSRSDMILRSANSVGGDAHYWSYGNFRIEKLDKSLGSLFSPNDPIIRASGDVNFDIYRGTSLHILAGGSVNIGTVIITGADTTGNTINPISTPTLANVSLSDGTPLVINGTTQPTLDIRAGTTAFETPGISGANFTTLTPTPNTTAPVTGANITVNNIDVLAPKALVFLTNQYQPNASLTGVITLGNINLRSDVGDSGSIIIDSRSNITINPGFISTRSSVGNSGDITLIAKDRILLGNNAYISSGTVGSNSKNSGNINLTAESLVMNAGTFLDASTRGTGDGGNININVRDSISLTDAFIFNNVEVGSLGQAGNINIQAKSLSLVGTTGIQADTIGFGNAGNISVQLDDFLSLINGGLISSSATTGSRGNSGNIEINVTGSVNLSGFNSTEGNSSGLFTQTAINSRGESGNITVNTSHLRIADGAVINASTFNSSNGGSIAINANSLEITGGGQVLSVTRSTGNAGNVNLNIADKISISGSDPNWSSRLRQFGSDVVTNEGFASGVFTNAGILSGNGGNLSIRAKQLDISNQGVITTSALGRGNSGNLSILATDSMNVVNQSIVTTSSNQGIAGSLDIQTGKLSIRDKSFIVSSTLGFGNAGDLTVKANDLIEIVNGSKIGADTLGSGNAGNLNVETRNLRIRDSEISTATSPNSSGKGGTLALKVSDAVEITGFSALATATFGSGRGGDLSIETTKLIASDGVRIEAGTAGIGQGGTVTVKASESIELSGRSPVDFGPTAISAFSLGSRGAKAGDLRVSTGQLIVRDGAEITVSSKGTANAGEMQINSDSLLLDNQGEIIAQTASGQGGNITLNVQDLLFLRRNSGISTTAGTALKGGDGGNIIIDAPFVVAIPQENSDITANAFDGRGGQVNVTTQGLFGIQPRPRLTPLSDITASSDKGPEFNGIISINAPINFTQNIAKLPTELADPSRQISQNCSPTGAASREENQFIITGKGGLPTNPNEPLQGDFVITNWVTLSYDKKSTSTTTEVVSRSPQQTIVEAQSWIIDEQGQIVLTVAASQVMPQGVRLPKVECNPR